MPCVTHDAYGQLPGISCPTLVIGGTDDRIVTGEADSCVTGDGGLSHARNRSVWERCLSDASD